MILALDNGGGVLTFQPGLHESLRNHILLMCSRSREINLPDQMALQHFQRRKP